MKLNRRAFFKATAAVAASGASLRAVADLKAMTSEERRPSRGVESWVTSVCQQCPGGCGIMVRRVGQRAVKIEGNPLHPINRGRLCPKGVAGIQALYDPDRIRGPLARVGERGEGRWRQVSWQEAIETVAGRLRALREQGEAHTLIVIGGQYRGLMRSFWQRFLQSYGSPNYVSTAAGCDGATLAPYLAQGIDAQLGYDLEGCRYLLSFGCGLLEAWWSPVRQAQAYARLRQGVTGARAKIVQVETRFSVTAMKSDEWVAIRPGTDGALALGLAYVIIKEGLYDRGFVEAQTFGFEEWRDEAGHPHMGFKDLVLKEYRPEVVSEHTGVPIGTIVRLAREFAESRPALALAERGATMHTNGLYNRLAIQALNALVGSIDVPGGVLLQKEPPLIPLPTVARDPVADRGLRHPRIDGASSRRFPLATQALPSLPDALLKGEPYRINALFLYYANPLFSVPDPGRLQEAIGKVPFVVSFSPFMDESSLQADLILPDHTYLERWQDDPVQPIWGATVVSLRQPVVSPRHNTRATGDVLVALAKAMGGSVAQAFPWQDFQEVLRASLQGLFNARRGFQFGIPFEEATGRLLEQAGFWIPSAQTFKEFWEQLAAKGGWWDPSYEHRQWERVFQTPSKKYEFYSQLLRRRLAEVASTTPRQRGLPSDQELEGLLKELGIEARGDRVYLPHFEPPRFVGDAREYPLHLNTYKLMAQTGTRTANQPWLPEALGVHLQERWEPWVEVNPETASRLGIRDGEWVWVESPVGRGKLRARLYAGAMPDVVNIPYGRGHRSGGRWAGGEAENPNRLVANEADRLAGLPAWYATRVRISKA